MAASVTSPTVPAKPGPSPHFTNSYIATLYATPVDQLTITQVESLYNALLHAPSKGGTTTVGSIFA